MEYALLGFVEVFAEESTRIQVCDAYDSNTVVDSAGVRGRNEGHCETDTEQERQGKGAQTGGH
jgi:hypothetical protein